MQVGRAGQAKNEALEIMINMQKAYTGKVFLGIQINRLQLSRHSTAKTKCRKFETNIPRKGISGP
jgi:hypothetical protein